MKMWNYYRVKVEIINSCVSCSFGNEKVFTRNNKLYTAHIYNTATTPTSTQQRNQLKCSFKTAKSLSQQEYGNDRCHFMCAAKLDSNNFSLLKASLWNNPYSYLRWLRILLFLCNSLHPILLLHFQCIGGAGRAAEGRKTGVIHRPWKRHIIIVYSNEICSF